MKPETLAIFAGLAWLLWSASAKAGTGNGNGTAPATGNGNGAPPDLSWMNGNGNGTGNGAPGTGAGGAYGFRGDPSCPFPHLRRSDGVCALPGGGLS